MKIVAENDKAYLMKEGKVVQAFDIEDIDAPEVEEVEVDPFEIGSRVAYYEKLGTIATKDISAYGPFYGVRFDDETFGEYEASDLTTTIIPSPNFDSPIEEIKSEWEEYKTIPSDTLDQVQTKASIARSLNLRAKALKTDKRTAFSDSVLLDRVATVTDVDILDLKTAEDLLQSNDEAGDYLAGLPTKADFKTIKGASDEDTRWLADLELDTPEKSWDHELTDIAESIVSKFDREQLEDVQFVQSAIDNQAEYLSLNDEKKQYLAKVIKVASEEKLAEPVIKTASVEEPLPPIDLDSEDLSDLYY